MNEVNVTHSYYTNKMGRRTTKEHEQNLKNPQESNLNRSVFLYSRINRGGNISAQRGSRRPGRIRVSIKNSVPAKPLSTSGNTGFEGISNMYTIADNFMIK